MFHNAISIWFRQPITSLTDNQHSFQNSSQHVAAFSCAVRSGAVLTGIFYPFKASSSIRKKAKPRHPRGKPLAGRRCPLARFARHARRVGFIGFPPSYQAAFCMRLRRRRPIFFTRVCVRVLGACAPTQAIHQILRAFLWAFVSSTLRAVRFGKVVPDSCVWFCGAAPFSARRRQT